MAKPEAHYHGHRKRLRERFLKSGLAGFAEHEVIELLLTLAIPRVDVKQPAKALLERSLPCSFCVFSALTEAPKKWS